MPPMKKTVILSDQMIEVAPSPPEAFADYFPLSEERAALVREVTKLQAELLKQREAKRRHRLA